MEREKGLSCMAYPQYHSQAHLIAERAWAGCEERELDLWKS